MNYSEIREREQEHIDELLKDDKKYEKELNKIYRQTKDQIVRDVNNEIVLLSKSDQVSLTEAKETISQYDVESYQEEAQRIVKEARERANLLGRNVTYADFSDEVNESLRKYNVTMRTNRLELLQARVNLATSEMADKEYNLLSEDIDKQLLDELERQAGILDMTVPSIGRAKQLIQTSLESSVDGVHFSDRIWANQKELTDEINNMIRRVLIRGEHPTKASADLRQYVNASMLGTKSKKGANWYADRLAVTESARAQTLAQKISFNEAKIKKYVYIAERDDKTCEICKGLDGKIMNVKDMRPFENAPAMHPWCRCSTAGVVD